MAMTGDFNALHSLTARIGELRSPSLRRDLAAFMGAEALSQIEEGFRNQRDPYGRAWPQSMRARQMGGQTLTERATLRRSFSQGGVHARPDGFTVGSNVVYAKAHQKGATITPRSAKALAFRLPGGPFVITRSVTLPKRQIIPEGNLGPIWGPAFEQAAEDFIDAHLGNP